MSKQAYLRIQELDKGLDHMIEAAMSMTGKDLAEATHSIANIKVQIALVVAINELTQAVDDVKRAIVRT